MLTSAINAHAALAELGYVCIEDLVDDVQLEEICQKLGRQHTAKAGDRRLLDHQWCRQLATHLLTALEAQDVIAKGYAAVLCTYFDKTAETNWGVAAHRDLSIPVKRRFEHTDWKNWSEKQSIPHVQPPRTVLERMVSVRLHIDPATSENGALMVHPRSHRNDDASAAPVLIEGPAGSALIMSPLVVHSSRKSTSSDSRRVLHFLFGPAQQEPPVEWYYAVE